MSVVWRSWDSLPSAEQQQLSWLVEELRSFAAGRALSSLLPAHDGLDRRREFIADGLCIKTYALLAKPETSGILPILRRLGCTDLTLRIEQLLETPIGSVSLIEALCLYRARTIAHPGFDYDDLQRQFERKGLDTDAAQTNFVRALGALFSTLDLLLPELETRYPQAAEDWRGELVAGMRTELISASALLADIGVVSSGTADWGKPVPSDSAGVYIVQLRDAPPSASRVDDQHEIGLAPLCDWLDRVPTLRLDGVRPTAEQLRARLGRYLWLESRVLYIGSTTRALHERVSDFYHHRLGSRSPHRGGQWLKTLRPDLLGSLEVVWHETGVAVVPSDLEEKLHEAFAERLRLHDPGRRALPAAELLPFANLETVKKIRRRHGLSRVDA